MPHAVETNENRTRVVVDLPSGRLEVLTDAERSELDRLCGYAARRSLKRGFVFVSKVLGKHYPVRPSDMRMVHEQLAERLIDVPGPAVLIGMAETATALGQGVFESLLHKSARSDVLYIQGTRYHFPQPLAVTFDESHSHATQHRIYQPNDPGMRELCGNAKSLILVDDEISTGHTLMNLAKAWRRTYPHVQNLCLVCITDWLGERRDLLLSDDALDIRIDSLLQGRFTFSQNPDFDPGVVPTAVGNDEHKEKLIKNDYARFGITASIHGRIMNLLDGTDIAHGLPTPWESLLEKKTLVLGTGEFAWPPFLLAEELERRGCDVMFQTTTRSPLIATHDLTSVIEFPDNYGDGIANYLYNVSDRGYDAVIIGYETTPLPDKHRLPKMLNALPVFF